MKKIIATPFLIFAAIFVMVGAVGLINDGIVIGSTAPTTNGAMRYNGGDLEVYKEGEWVTTTGSGSVVLNTAVLAHNGSSTDTNADTSYDLLALDYELYSGGTALTVDTTNNQIQIEEDGNYLAEIRVASDSNANECSAYLFRCDDGTNCTDANLDAQTSCEIMFTPNVYGYYNGYGSSTIELPLYLDGGNNMCVGFQRVSGTCTIDLRKSYLKMRKID